MHLSRLELRGFRSYPRLALDFRPRTNILFGPNGEGKTNVLEAIFFLATARSHRGARDAELLGWGSDRFEIAAHVVRLPTQVRLEIAWSPDGRKQLRVGGKPEPKLSNLIGRLNAVMFAPEDLSLLKGPPAVRRRFLDMELSQLSRTYFHHLQEYQRALAQRNALLRNESPSPSLRALLEVYDQPLIEHGSQVAARRSAAVLELSPRARAYHGTFSDGRESLGLRYVSTLDAASEVSTDPSALAEAFARRLTETRRDEEYRRTTLVGPHRDDLEVQIDGRDARVFGSQGQQRSAVLALKLAELEHLREVVGEEPVLLLDDVTSELDSRRRRFLLEAVARNAQTFITTTGLDDLDPGWLVDADLWQVCRGSVSPRAN